MNIRVAVGLYAAVWLVLAALFVAGMSYAGFSFWWSVPLAYLIFAVVNGTLAYGHRCYRLSQHGLPAPSYLRYLLVGNGFKREVHVPRPVRWLLALVVGAGGMGFVGLAAILATQFANHHVPSPIAAASLLFLLAVLGLCFVYVGVCLALVKGNERLLSRARLPSWRRANGA